MRERGVKRMGHRHPYGPELPVQDARLDPRIVVAMDRVIYMGSGTGTYGRFPWMDWDGRRARAEAVQKHRPAGGRGPARLPGLLRRSGRGIEGFGRGLLRLAGGLHVLAAGLEALERGTRTAWRTVAGLPRRALATAAFIVKRTWSKKGA